MSTNRDVRGARRRRQRGNAFIELSLCILPLFALFFGISDIALAVFLKSMLQSSVREGVRFAVTYQTTNGGTACGSQAACIKQIVQTNALGFLAGTTGSNLITVNYFDPTDLSTPLAAGCCGTGRTLRYDSTRKLLYINQTGNVVEVSVNNFPWNWLVPLPNFMQGTRILMNASSSDILQGYPVGTTTPPTP